MVEHPEYRLSADERAEAIRLLDEHYRAGRLDPEEYEDRRGRAMDAVTRADLAVLFVDLPTRPAVVAGPGSAVATTQSGRGWREAVLGLLPLLALLLFFTTGRWWWFLLIPAAAIILRSGNGGSRC